MLRPFSLGLGIAALAIAACSKPDPRGEGLVVTPAVVDFGEVVVGLLARRALFLDNQTPEVVRVIEARPTDPIADAIRLERVPAALVAGSSAEAEVVFAPDHEGTFDGAIHIVTDGDTREYSVDVSGVAVAPFLRAFPETIDFGRVRIREAVAWTATVSNEGSRTVIVNAITPDAESEEFSVGPYAIETLEPGESFSFDVIFQPLAGGLAIGRVVIGDDSPRPVPLSITVMGEGVDGDIEIEPTYLDFTGALVGEERIRFFELRNAGTATHTIDEIAISQGDPPAFSIATSSLSFPFSIGPGQERRISVRFAPTIATAHSGSVRIDSSASLGQVSLFGQASAPPVSALVVLPRAIDFGGVEVGSTGSRELGIQSSGYIDVHLTEPIELDPPNAPFILAGAPVNQTLKAFDSHTIEVFYRPETEENHSAVLRIRSDAAGSQVIEVALVGRGEALPSPDADPRPTVLQFGSVPRDSEAVRTIILLNGGTAPLSITGVEVEEDAGGRFLLDEVPITSSILPGESRPIQIRYFDPFGLAASETGTVAVSTDDPDRPVLRIPMSARTTAPRPEQDDDIRIHTNALDLHLIQAGSLFDRPTDCCWCNPNPAWGDVAQSPFLDNDFTGGQTIRFSRADGSYIVEVHSREATVTTAEVTIGIYDSPSIVRTRELGPGQRWRVGTITFFGFQRSGRFATASFPLDTPMADSCY